MHTMKTFLLLMLALGLGTTFSAQERLRIGLLPFDVANVDGGTHAAATALAKLVRAEMITDKRVQPVLLDVPDGAKLPLSPPQLATLAEQNNLQLIIAGTILEATTERGSNRISTGGLGGRIGTSVGGSMTRTRAEVKMHVELAGKDGEVSDAFQVEGSNTDVGVGTDIWSAIGSFDLGDHGWDKSPMGKALREAAQKLSSETMRRKGR